MVDKQPSPDALRMRRARRHAKGDHGMCAVANCASLREAATPDEPMPADAGLEVAVRAFIESLGFASDDPRSLLAEIAARLARLLDTSPNAASARELRVLIQQLIEVPNGPSGPIDELRARRAARRLDMIISHAEKTRA